jgi:hypothetical protein
MGFSVKLAPGVRIRASNRGIRAGIGPRAARVHVGTGRPGFSSGVGPFSVYTSVGGKRRSRSRGGGPSAAALERQAAAARRAQAQAEKLQEARRLAVIFQEILNLHREEFEAVQRPAAPMPLVPDVAKLREQHEKTELRGIGLFKRAERAAARQRAAEAAETERAALRQRARAERKRAQAELDGQWRRLTGNDPDTVIATLTEAFEDNEAPAAPVGVDGDELSLVVLVPGEDAVPERMPGTTQAGNLTLRKLPKGERSQLYRELAAGHVLVTLRETFAVAPGINAARVVAVRHTPRDVYGTSRLECILAGRWPRDAFGGVRWQEADASAILTESATVSGMGEPGGGCTVRTIRSGYRG